MTLISEEEENPQLQYPLEKLIQGLYLSKCATVLL